MENTNSVQFFREQKYVLPQTAESPILVAWKLVTPENYGSLLRLADSIGCSKVVFVGSEDAVSSKKIEKVAGNSFKSMCFEFVDADHIMAAIPSTHSLVAIETAQRSTNIYKTSLPANIAFVVGSEKHGVDPLFLEECKQIVHVPLTGHCTSLNVSHAAAVAMFEWLRQVSFK